MKQTFKKYLVEQMTAQALEMAANLLDTQTSKLKIVAGDLEDEVLEVGKEVKKQMVKVALGNLIVRLYKALGKMFARVELPDGENATYMVAG